MSTPDVLTSQDPENSGFGLNQVVVWEEWNGIDWDIRMQFNTLDGAPPSWNPASRIVVGTPVDEINPAVAVTCNHPVTGTEIHVVYQSWNPAGGGQWDVCHTMTSNWGVAWSVPVVLDTAAGNDAIDPAIVFTEDLLFPGIASGMLVQFTWSEFNLGTGFYEIQYDAYYYDPGLVPVRGYVGPTLIRACPFGNCEVPEIASVDERRNAATYDYYFAVVWQEPAIGGQLTIWYVDGTTTTTPAPPLTWVFNPSGQISPFLAIGDSYDPDIAATQDYINPETYYFHVNWVTHPLAGPPINYLIGTCYALALVPTPGFLAFIPTAFARGPVNFVLDRPTIASKVTWINPTIFETWMCWEDSSNPISAPDIWYRVGSYVGGGPFAYTMGPAIVPYVPSPAPPFPSEFNPELWNRNDNTRPFPPLTHLVFDMTSGGPFWVQEVEYIDP